MARKYYKELLDKIKNCQTKQELETLRDEIYENISSKVLDVEESFLIGEYIGDRRSDLY